MSDRTKPGIAAAAGSNSDEADLGDLAVECVGDALLQLAISATPSGSEDDAVWAWSRGIGYRASNSDLTTEDPAGAFPVIGIGDERDSPPREDTINNPPAGFCHHLSDRVGEHVQSIWISVRRIVAATVVFALRPLHSPPRSTSPTGATWQWFRCWRRPLRQPPARRRQPDGLPLRLGPGDRLRADDRSRAAAHRIIGRLRC